MGLAPVGPEAAGKTAWEGATSQGIQAASGSWKRSPGAFTDFVTLPTPRF